MSNNVLVSPRRLRNVTVNPASPTLLTVSCGTPVTTLVLTEVRTWASLVAQTGEATCSAGDLGTSPGAGRSPGGGNGNPL